MQYNSVRVCAFATWWTRKPSCMYCGSRARRSSIVSYWPGQAFSFSRDPSMHFSNTSPTRNIIFTPIERTKEKYIQRDDDKPACVVICVSESDRHTGTCPTLWAQTTRVEFWKMHTCTTQSCRGWALSCVSQGADKPEDSHALITHLRSVHPTVWPPTTQTNNWIKTVEFFSLTWK